jgi:hypothetical protein
LEENFFELQGRERKSILKISNLNADILNAIKQIKIFEDNQIKYENKILELEEEIKLNKEKYNSSIIKLENDNFVEKKYNIIIII